MDVDHMVLTEDDVYKWKCAVRAIPLDDSYVPVGGSPLEDMSDQALLDVPPHMICHVQRTAAQGGLQVISPRQTPFSCLMDRVSRDTRDIGDHVVGSTAYNEEGWPTLDGASLAGLLPDQPLSMKAADAALRQKTRTEPLTASNRILTDPILSCLVKGRACIDLLRRDDVSGGAEELAQLLAEAWGISKQEMDDMDAFTLGVTGSLLRHCIKADEVFPTIHAPIQIKRCIGVGASQVSREVLPEDCAMDWRRFRVFCEAVFYLATSTEGYSLKQLASHPAPGDPTARPNRSGVMCFVPAPATSWCHAPSTFCITPVLESDMGRGLGVPSDVYKALTRYVEVARPMLKIEALTAKTRARRTSARQIEPPLGETLTAGYSLMTRCLLVGSARGKTSSAAVRNIIYKALDSSPLPLRLRLARYISIAASECRVHLGLDEVPDSIIDKLASKFRPLGEHIRIKIAEEAVKRGKSIEEWWSDCMAQVPGRFEEFKEGTAGWTKIGLWLTFKANSHKWHALSKAVEFSALREAEASAVGNMSLPPAYGSPDRMEAVGRATVANVTRVYAGYYSGVADVALAISDELDKMRKPTSANKLRDAAFLWTLRARILRGSNFYTIPKEEPLKSKLHTRFVGPQVDAVLAPAPYRAFKAYQAHVQKSSLPSDFKKHIGSHEATKISDAFRSYRRIVSAVGESLATRYMLRPWEMASDMEKGWGELVSDIRDNLKKHAYAPTTTKRVAEQVIQSTFEGITMPLNENKMDYFACLAELEQDQVDYIMDKLDAMSEEVADTIMYRDYAGPQQMVDVVVAMEDPREHKSKKAKETVN